MFKNGEDAGTTLGYVPPKKPPKKWYVKGRVTKETFQAWQAYSEHNNATLGGLLEVIGQQIAIRNETGEPVPALTHEELIKKARQVDVDRRRRGERY